MSWEGWASALAKAATFLQGPSTPESDVESGAFGARIGEQILAQAFPRPAGEMSWEESWKIRDEAAKGNFQTRRNNGMSAIGKMPGPWAGGYVFPDEGGDGGGGEPHHHKRINPMNARAARRAVARLRGSMRLLHRIESMLPQQRHSKKKKKFPFHHRRR